MPTHLRRILAAGTLLLALVAISDAPAQSDQPQEAPAVLDERIETERIRAQVEAIYSDLMNPPDRGENPSPPFQWVTERLLALGPGVGPVMIADLENRSRATFNLAAYVVAYLAPPGAKEALVRAGETADRDGGEFGKDRKAWIGYAVAMLEDPYAVDLLDTGKLNIVGKEFVEGMSILEVASILSAPASRAPLLKKLERYGPDEELQDRLPVVLDSLRRVADPSIVGPVTPFLKHPDAYVRDAAARALAASGDPKVADRLIQALDDQSAFAKFGIASSLEVLKPAGKTRAILARLEVEDDTAARGALYRTLAATAPESQVVQAFVTNWGRTDPLDRVAIVDTLGKMRSKKGVNLLKIALADPDPRVTLHAADALTSVDGAGVTDTLLALLTDRRWTVESAALRALINRQERRAAPRIAERFRAQIASPISDPGDRDPLRGRGEGLIELRDTSTLPDIETALLGELDPSVEQILVSLAARMRALREYGDDRSRWISAATAEDAELRRLAYSRLIEMPGPDSTPALTEAFGRVDVKEGFEILRGIGRISSPDAAPLLERVLLDPAFDAYERLPLRRMAAWSAVQIGGERMLSALRSSVERRDGRDADVLVYLAVATGKDALPVLDAYRYRRFRYFEWHLALEWERMDWLAREIRAGRSVQSLNRPPDEIALYPFML